MPHNTLKLFQNIPSIRDRGRYFSCEIPVQNITTDISGIYHLLECSPTQTPINIILASHLLNYIYVVNALKESSATVKLLLLSSSLI